MRLRSEKREKRLRKSNDTRLNTYRKVSIKNPAKSNQNNVKKILPTKNAKCNNNNNSTAILVKKTEKTERRRSLKKTNTKSVPTELTDDCKENCWQEDLTLFDETLANTSCNNRKNYMNEANIGLPEDSLNQFGPIVYDAPAATTTVSSDRIISQPPCQCFPIVKENDKVNISHNPNSAVLLTDIDNVSNVKCISECDSTTELEAEVVNPSTLNLPPVSYNTNSTINTETAVIDVVVSEVDSTTDNLGALIASCRF